MRTFAASAVARQSGTGSVSVGIATAIGRPPKTGLATSAAAAASRASSVSGSPRSAYARQRGRPRMLSRRLELVQRGRGVEREPLDRVPRARARASESEREREGRRVARSGRKRAARGARGARVFLVLTARPERARPVHAVGAVHDDDAAARAALVGERAQRANCRAVSASPGAAARGASPSRPR